MEKETPVTPEDFYYSHAEFSRWLKDLMPHEEDHLKSMLEEYGQMCAEQARREERAIHKPLVDIIRNIMKFDYKDTRSEIYMAEKLAAAGYEGKEGEQ